MSLFTVTSVGRGGGALAKDWWQGCVATLTLFLQLALTHWTLFLTHSHPMTPFLIIHNQFCTISHRMTPFFDISSKFYFFLKVLSKMCLNLYFLPPQKKIGQNLSLILTFDPPFWSSYWMTPFFGEKSPTKKTPSFELLSEHPCHLYSRVPPPGNCHLGLLCMEAIWNLSTSGKLCSFTASGISCVFINQTSYTTLCKGVVSHGAPIQWGIWVFAKYTNRKQTQTKCVHDLCSYACASLACSVAFHVCLSSTHRLL